MSMKSNPITCKYFDNSKEKILNTFYNCSVFKFCLKFVNAFIKQASSFFRQSVNKPSPPLYYYSEGISHPVFSHRLRESDGNQYQADQSCTFKHEIISVLIIRNQLLHPL